MKGILKKKNPKIYRYYLFLIRLTCTYALHTYSVLCSNYDVYRVLSVLVPRTEGGLTIRCVQRLIVPCPVLPSRAPGRTLHGQSPHQLVNTDTLDMNRDTELEQKNIIRRDVHERSLDPDPQWRGPCPALPLACSPYGVTRTSLPLSCDER